MMMEGIQIVDVPIRWVNEGEKRLDAGFYAQDVIKARILIENLKKKNIRILHLNNLSKDILIKKT